MNNELFDINWKQIRTQTTAWWSLINDSDLEKVDKAAVKFDKYSTLLRVKYGYANDQAKKEIDKRLVQVISEQKNILTPLEAILSPKQSGGQRKKIIKTVQSGK